MATNDFVHDLVDKLHEDNMEFVVVTIQKGKIDHKASAHYNIRTKQGCNMILATIEHVFADDEEVVNLIDTEYFIDPDDTDSADGSDNPKQSE